MKETFICNLEKHSIYYLNNSLFGFYIFIPYKDYKETNIVIRLKSNYQIYDLNKNPIDKVTNELINYYKTLDNYNITLILPIFYDDILTRIATTKDLDIYYRVDHYLGNMFNSAYDILTRNGIKVNSNIYVINNDSFKNFTNWFVSRYNNRIEYKTILELIKENDGYSSYNVIKTPNINFVIGRNEVPELEKTKEIELDTFDSIAEEIEKENAKKEKKPSMSIKQIDNTGSISYVLLALISFLVSLGLLFIFVK